MAFFLVLLKADKQTINLHKYEYYKNLTKLGKTIFF